MKLTTTILLDLQAAGLSAEAVVLYLSANTWAMERGVRVLSCAAFSALPGAPRNPKALGRIIIDLMAAGLLAEAQGGYEVLERLSAAAARMRRHRANNARTGDADRSVTERERVTPLVHEQTANRGEAQPSPPAPPLPELSGLDSLISESSSLLSSDQRPESKRARKAPKVAMPADFDAAIRPRVLAWAKGESYPDWWVADRLEQMKLDCGSKGVVFADWYLGAIGWLRREDKQYGNGPDAILARRQRNGKPPGLVAHERHRAEEDHSPAPYNQRWLDR